MSVWEEFDAEEARRAAEHARSFQAQCDEADRKQAKLNGNGTKADAIVIRLPIAAEPPSLDAGEATDKGSINQRAVLSRRAALVEELYAPAASNSVISIDQRK